jgi:hypothetical protein
LRATNERIEDIKATARTNDKNLRANVVKEKRSTWGEEYKVKEKVSRAGAGI